MLEMHANARDIQMYGMDVRDAVTNWYNGCSHYYLSCVSEWWQCTLLGQQVVAVAINS